MIILPDTLEYFPQNRNGTSLLILFFIKNPKQDSKGIIIERFNKKLIVVMSDNKKKYVQLGNLQDLF